MDRFPKNARVCFIGDSITCANEYLSRIVAYYHEHFAAENINFYNCAMSGAKSQDLLDIFDSDIMTYRPTHAVIFVGINDSGREMLQNGRSPALYEALKTNFEIYRKNLDTLCTKLVQAGVAVTLCTSTPPDEYSDFDTPTIPGGFALMASYAEFVRNYAQEKGFPLCDYFAYFTKALQSGEVLYCTDRIHPNELGSYHLAKCFLAFQGLDAGEYCPIPQYLQKWRELVFAYRYMLTAELLWCGSHDLSFEAAAEKLDKVRKTEGENEFFMGLYHNYIKTKPNQSKVKQEMIAEMEQRLNHADCNK